MEWMSGVIIPALFSAFEHSLQCSCVWLWVNVCTCVVTSDYECMTSFTLCIWILFEYPPIVLFSASGQIRFSVSSCVTMSEWLCIWIVHLNIHTAGALTVLISDDMAWCHTKLLPSWHMFCPRQTTMHQFTVLATWSHVWSSRVNSELSVKLINEGSMLSKDYFWGQFWG